MLRKSVHDSHGYLSVKSVLLTVICYLVFKRSLLLLHKCTKCSKKRSKEHKISKYVYSSIETNKPSKSPFE